MNDKSVRWSRAKRDTIDLTLVSLVSGCIQTATLLKATTFGGSTGNDAVYNDMHNKFMLSIRNTGTFAFPSYQLLSGAGGKFNNSAIYDKDGYSLFTNVNGVSPGYLQSLAPSGPALILNGTTLTVLKKCNSLFTN